MQTEVFLPQCLPGAPQNMKHNPYIKKSESNFLFKLLGLYSNEVGVRFQAYMHSFQLSQLSDSAYMLVSSTGSKQMYKISSSFVLTEGLLVQL